MSESVLSRCLKGSVDWRLPGVTLAALLLVACASDGPAPVESRTRQSAVRPASPQVPPTNRSGIQQDLPQTYVVKKGDSLHAIAFRFGLDVRNVAQWNGLRNPNLIYPGQRLRLYAPGAVATRATPPPIALDRIPPQAMETIVDVPLPQARESQEPIATTTPAPVPASPPSPAAGSGRWSWPADGEVTAATSAMGTKGIKILGARGQPVGATADGEVVYSGNGLRGYGNLIIIRHDAEFLSAYAHNDKALVREGDHVKAGQKIAEMGDSGAQEVMLHFELRMNGIAVDPLRYLPRRTLARN